MRLKTGTRTTDEVMMGRFGFFPSVNKSKNALNNMDFGDGT
jgi:hypothetical protein